MATTTARRRTCPGTILRLSTKSRCCESLRVPRSVRSAVPAHQSELQDTERRTARQVKKDMCKRVVFVKNLPKVISIDEVKELFDKYGEVAEVRLRRFRGFSFIAWGSESGVWWVAEVRLRRLRIFGHRPVSMLRIQCSRFRGLGLASRGGAFASFGVDASKPRHSVC